MASFEQFEVWAEKGGQWGVVAAFRDFDVASAVAANYKYRMRLVHAVYSDSRRVKEEVLVEMGSTRQEP